MLGLNQHADSHGLKSIASSNGFGNGNNSNGNSNSNSNINFRQGRSYKFAQQLTGRFHVAGLTGGMIKHNKIISSSNQNIPTAAVIKSSKLSKNPTQSELVTQMRQEEELQRDAARLYELELKLDAIRKQKILRLQRDENRKKHKIIYHSVVKIQRAWRGVKRWKLLVSSSIITIFLKSIMARQSIAAAAWAAKVIKRFAQTVRLFSLFACKLCFDLLLLLLDTVSLLFFFLFFPSIIDYFPFPLSLSLQM